MGDALLGWIVFVLVIGISGKSFYVWIRERSLAGHIAGVSALLAVVSLFSLIWMSSAPDGEGWRLLRTIAALAAIVLILISLVACAIVRSRVRASRGSRAWISFLPVPFLALPLLFAGLIAILDHLAGY